MTEIINDEKINIHSLTKKLRVTDIKQFDAYLKDIWVDLFSRVTENKNDKDKSVKLNGLSKVVFNSYYNLPGLIGDRLFKVFDTNCNNSIELIEFVEGMRTLFYEDYEKNSRFIFDFYDFDNDGKISQEDIRVVLSYITLTYMEPNNSEKKIIDGINISYKNRLTSQEELCDILSNCFNDSHIKTSKINYKQFKYIIENINSDIYLMIFLFLLERKPFTNKNIKSYEHHSRNSSKNSSNSSKGKRKRLLASPTKHANFSPYRRFHNKNSSINLQKQNSINLHTHM
jgi:Ca2+-binding EF-hand superfamily protein